MVAINIQYQGDLHCEATHGPSGTTLSTDAPKDNHGRGESFSPTDLVATALGSCLLSIMGILAKRLDIDLSGATADVIKEMSAAPRRIASLSVVLKIPTQVDHSTRQKFERAALACPVHNSLHPDMALPISFIWGDQTETS